MLNFESEISRIIKELMKNLPDEVHPRLENRFLRPLFGLSSDDLLPTPGTVYNDIKLYPMFISKRVVASTQR